MLTIESNTRKAPAGWFSVWWALACLLVSGCEGRPESGKGTGLVFATEDQLRSIPLASTPYSGATLPASVDLSASLPPPGDQGEQGSCVGWAVAYALKTFEEFEEERHPLTNNVGQPNPSRVFSPAYIYNQLNRGVDAGIAFVDALNLLHSDGAATLDMMPYSAADFQSQPSIVIRVLAKKYRIDTWRRVNPADPIEVKAQLNARYPVLIGARIDEDLRSAGHGFVWKQRGGDSAGGHAMLVVGYDDARSAFRVMNSWGQEWGDRGFFWIDYDYFRQVVQEAYVVKDASNGPGPAPPAPSPPSPPDPDPAPSPVPPPAPAASALLEVVDVVHNIPVLVAAAAGPMNVPGMRFEGDFRIPQGTPGAGQIVVQVYRNYGGAKGEPVGSLDPHFATPQGLSATGTPPFSIPATGMRSRWSALLPYESLAVPRGRPDARILTELIAEPVLYVNGFGVALGRQVNFSVAF